MELSDKRKSRYRSRIGYIVEKFEVLKEKGLIGAVLAEELKRLNGMRNVIVHKYGDVNTELIMNSLETIKEQLSKFIEALEGELS